ncbi:ATP-binding protein [Nocardia sp. NPDC059180]|uniref:ATP-binding protein n=1 Tax=Nocardia sp. NPDC059180 TaxID=3346761 RepID=UPI0036B68709
MSAGNIEWRAGRVTADDFVGREHELDAIVTLLLRGTRLLTLIGPGGIGKTRLAAKAAQHLAMKGRMPVRCVRLARLDPGSDTAAVEQEIARSVVTTDYSDRSTWDRAALAMADPRGRVVLVLDNCEHVLAAVGVVIDRMLAAIPGLSIVATSREAIGWMDEQRFVVPPLPPHHALQLFRDRAELTDRPIGGADDTAVADEICRQMDYHPLFIRLAAGRLACRPLRMILREICGDPTNDRRLTWPPTPVVGGEERHRSINDVVGWSYDQCSAKEQVLFGRLSVFAGGYDTDPGPVDAPMRPVGADLDAIRRICADPGVDHTDGRISIPGEEVEDLLERLADQSLVSRHITATTVRYSLSGNLRVYAQQQLRRRTRGGVDAAVELAERHSHYYRDKIREAAQCCFDPTEEGGLIDWANAAWHNIILAVDRGLAPGGNAIHGLEICVAMLMLRLAVDRGSLQEMRLRTERALDATRELDPPPNELRMTAMALLGPATYAATEIRGAQLRLVPNEVQQPTMGTSHAGERAIRTGSSDDTQPRWTTLTAAEQDVAVLAAAAWTNSAIAARRGRSRRTVDAQIAAVLLKLQITSRAEIARFVPNDRAERPWWTDRQSDARSSVCSPTVVRTTADRHRGEP